VTTTKTDPFRLDGKAALVTGAGRGLGKVIANTLATAGARIICGYDRDKRAADETAAHIGRTGGTAESLHIDLAQPTLITSRINTLREAGTTVDILINNAAIRPRAKIEDVDPAEWDRVMAVNLRGPFFLAQAVVPDMRNNNWGRIINISGVDAHRGGVQRVHVSASKLGLIGMTRAFANETALAGITVNAVVPGLMDTQRYHAEWTPELTAMLSEVLDTIPMGRLGDPSEIANACLYLASNEAGYITGQELVVSGGAYPLVRQKTREEPAQSDATH
jgi:3-oxoacyl-[acyl-carrier protein] reductase